MDDTSYSSNNGSGSSASDGRIGWKLTALFCLLILMIGAGLTVFIFSTEPTASRVGATRETAMLVDVAGVQRGTFQPTIVAMGNVEPEQDITLRPRIEGEIVEISSAFTPGGFAEKGDMLLRIDPSDYRNALQQRKSELRQAVADLNIEMGRQNVARKDYQLFKESLSSENEALVLREPQLNAARARVESARAAVEQAELELARTTIAAPFDAHILSRNVNVGSQVSVGDDLGRLVGLDTYWVVATVPISKLRWLSFPDEAGEPGSLVRIRNRSAWPEGEYRTGRLYKLIGALEDRTRLARVLVAVDDPLAYRTGSADLPALMIGAFVEASIRARPIRDVVRVDRDYIRKDDAVWVMADGKLDIREVDIVFRDAEYAYIRKGLEEGDRVVTTNLATVADGAPLRLSGGGEASGSDAVETGGKNNAAQGGAQ